MLQTCHTAIVNGYVVEGHVPAEAVRQVLVAFAEFSEAKDLSGMDTLFAPDDWVRIIEGAGVDSGWADYRDHHIGPELEHLENFWYRYFAIEP